MKSATAQVWANAPEPGIPESPALHYEGKRLWLAYEIAASMCRLHAVIRFQGVIDHHLSPINDEGLGQHPYFKAGLKFYSFHELFDSEETRRWRFSQARHWVITFKDETLDVVACAVEVVEQNLAAS